MAVSTESAHNGGFIASEANGTRSREVVTIVANSPAMGAGFVLGKVTASGKYSDYDADQSDGTETAAAVLVNAVPADASNDQEATVLIRDAEVVQAELAWTDKANDETAGLADLAGLGIIAR